MPEQEDPPVAADPTPGPAAQRVLRTPLCRDCGGRMGVHLMGRLHTDVHPACDALGPEKRWWSREGRRNPLITRRLALAAGWWLTRER